MSSAIISVESLSKSYMVGHEGPRERYHSLRDTIVRNANNFARTTRDMIKGKQIVQGDSVEEFWALKDVSFEVKQGEVLGIIGRNGAGKSTLLKILSRITEPTKGRVTLRGRVASLLEVGTGFHPELTGRENIFLNGAILGMTKAEIKNKFDEIVAFAEVEKFLDTPVKRYSSGMYVRLAFAVAAHLEPEILIVDEVLAVGDAQFQKKCMGKMQDVAGHGRTVLFISHNMQAVTQLCSTAVLLSSGEMVQYNETHQVINAYLSINQGNTGETSWKLETAPGTETARLCCVRTLDNNKNICGSFDIAQPLSIVIDFWILKSTKMTVSVHLYNVQGINLFASANWTDAVWGKHLYEPGLNSSCCTIPGNFLNEGDHIVKVYLTRDNNAGIIDVALDNAITFNIFDSGESRNGFLGTWLGSVRPLLPWTGQQISSILK